MGMRNLRKEQVRKIREEGRQAFRDCASRQSNPYGFMDAYQWFRGFDEEVEQVERGLQATTRQES